jgi:hypothetical protein
VTGRLQGRDPWVVGWLAGSVVVGVAAGLLVTITALARRVAGQAESIQAALEGARSHVEPLLDLGAVNGTLLGAVEAAEGPAAGTAEASA